MRIQIQIFCVHFSKIFLYKLLFLLTSFVWFRFFFSLVTLSILWLGYRMGITILSRLRSSGFSTLKEYFHLRVLLNRNAFSVCSWLRTCKIRFKLFLHPYNASNTWNGLRVLFGMFCVSFWKRPVLTLIFLSSWRFSSHVLRYIQRISIYVNLTYFLALFWSLGPKHLSKQRACCLAFSLT